MSFLPMPPKLYWKRQVPARHLLTIKNISFLFPSPPLQQIIMQKGKKSYKTIQKDNSSIVCLTATF